MTVQDREEVQTAVHNFNNSPWIVFGDPMITQDVVARAEEVGKEMVLEEIRRQDIRAFHAEEAACGCI